MCHKRKASIGGGPDSQEMLAAPGELELPGSTEDPYSEWLILNDVIYQTDLLKTEHINLKVYFPVNIQQGRTGMLSLFSLDHLYFLCSIYYF